LLGSRTQAQLVGTYTPSRAQVGSSTVDVVVKQAPGLECQVDKEPLRLHYNHLECSSSCRRWPTDLLKNFHTLRTATRCSARKMAPHHTRIPDSRQKSAKPRRFRSTAGRNPLRCVTVGYRRVQDHHNLASNYQSESETNRGWRWMHCGVSGRSPVQPPASLHALPL